MSVTGFPWIENLRVITDAVTQRFVNCTAKQIEAGYAWRSGVVDAVGSDGGIDTVPGRNFLKARQISVTLVKVYGANETFKTATRDMEMVLNPGNPLTLTFVEDDGRTWFWDVRVLSYDKVHSLTWVGYMEFPITFVAVDPRQRAQFKPGIYLLDDGHFLDDGWTLDIDPDAYSLSGTTNDHTITNDGTASDEAPIVSLQGPITGPITGTYRYTNGPNISWSYGLSIASGETVTIDASQPEVVSSNPSVDAYHAFTPPTATRGWGFIDVGTTHFVLTYQSAVNPASCSISWSPRK